MRLLKFRRHPVSEEELSAYLDGRLSARTKERVDAHLQTCLDCSHTLEDLRLLVAEMGRMPQAKAPRSFALSPEMASAARHEGERIQRNERVAFRRAYLGLSGASVAAAVLLIALFASDVGIFSRQGSHSESPAGGAAAVRVPAAATSSDQNLQAGPLTKSTEGETEGAEPGVAPSPPALMAPAESDSAVNATPPAASTPMAVTAAEAPASDVETEGSSHLWLWVLEGAAGGLLIGLGASAFWMRRRWVEVNRK